MECKIYKCNAVYIGKVIALLITQVYAGTEFIRAEIDLRYVQARSLDQYENVNVFGRLQEEGRSFLQIKWNHIQANQSGTYRCYLRFLAGRNEYRTIEDSLTIEDNDLIQGLYGQVDIPDTSAQIQPNKKAYTDKYEETSYNRHYIIGDVSCYVELELCRQKAINDLFHEPMIHGLHKYYISKGLFKTDVESDRICHEVLNGYLAEIDDTAVASYLRNNKVTGGLIGGTIYLNIKAGYFDIH